MGGTVRNEGRRSVWGQEVGILHIDSNYPLLPGNPQNATTFDFPVRYECVGGLEIPAEVGAEAHSDGDVLIHAIVDAMLGAMGQGDIGTHFPDRDPRWRGQASRLFLERTAEMVRDRGYRLVNIDSTESKLTSLLREFDFISIAALLDLPTRVQAPPSIAERLFG